jgi:hypothetical protein
MPDETLSTTEFTESSITFTPDLQPRDGETPLSEQDAAELLWKRFGGRFGRDTTTGEDIRAGLGAPYFAIFDQDRLRGRVTDQGKQAAAHDLMLRIVRTIPEQYRTQSVLGNVDIRPILSEVILTEQQAARTRAVHYVNGVPFTPDERVIAGEMLVTQNKAIADQAITAAAAMEQSGAFDNAPDPLVARQQWIEQMVNGWRNANGALGPTPQVVVEAETATDPATQQAAQAQLAGGTAYEKLLAAGGLIDGTGTPYQFLTDADVQNMFRMNMVEWNSIMESERNKVEARQAGATGVPEDLQIDHGGLLGGGNYTLAPSSPGGDEMRPVPGSGRRIRMLDAFNSLYSASRTPTELRNLQDKLIAGGYLNEEDIRYWGRATDDATIDAWRTLIRDSINLGKDMGSVLTDSTLAKRATDEEDAHKLQRDLVLTSGIGIQTMADALGQQVIGRKLDADQHAQVVEFIHQLERNQATALNPEGGQVAEAVDVEAEVAAWIQREEGTEAGAYDLIQQFQTFNEIARGSR